MAGTKLSIDVETETAPSTCCECGHDITHASGPVRPSPGDFSLCIRCASLNVFAEDMTVRKPTFEEYCVAAADSDVQHMRRILLAIKPTEA